MLIFLEKKERKKNSAVTASCIALKNVFDTAGSLQQGIDEQSISMHALFSGFSQYHTFVGANVASKISYLSSNFRSWMILLPTWTLQQPGAVLLDWQLNSRHLMYRQYL